MIKNFKKYLTLIAALTSLNAIAVEKMSPADIEIAQSKLQTTFTELEIKHFQPSVVPGLYEVFAGNNILYFHPESQTIFFGQLYNKDGVSLTDKSRQEFASTQMKDLPMDSGIIIGNPDGVEVTEIGQMDCGYCQRADDFFSKLEKKMPVKRRYFFLDVPESQYPTARKKAVHIICSEDPSQAFTDINKNKITEYKTCDKADGVLKDHQMVAQAFGVNGTPTFLLNEKILPGFSSENRAEIESFVKQELSTPSVN